MLINPNFSQGVVGWTFGTGWSIVPGPGPSGESNVGRFAGAGTSAITNGNRLSCVQGTTIAASCVVEGAPGSTGTAYLRINTYSSSDTILTTTTSSAAIPNISWETLVVSTTTLASNTAYATIDFAILGAGSSDLWVVSEFNASNGTQPMLMTGDYLQIGYRLYRVLQNVYADAFGNASISLWPNLRDQPADGTAIVTRNCKGLFRLASNSGNKFSVNPGAYGLSGFQIREAL